LTQSKEIVHAFGTRHPPVYPDEFRPAILNQVHGNRVIIVSEHGHQGDGDGMITRVPQIALTIKTADCVPVLFYDEGKKIVGAVHSGWRGLYNEVIVYTLKKATEIFGSDISSIKAVVGPCIEESCYEIGKDVLDKFKERFKWWQDIIKLDNNKIYLNLRKGVTLQMINMGVKPDNIEQIELCTFCRGDLFYSWRRDGRKKERMFSFIGLKKTDEKCD
jgi:YfiH family protein